MSFVPKTAAYSGKINAVTLGTGDKAIVIGGQNVLPFYTFDAPIENAPKVGVEVSDTAASATQSATERLAPLGSADSKFRAMKSQPSMVSALAAKSAMVVQPA